MSSFRQWVHSTNPVLKLNLNNGFRTEQLFQKITEIWVDYKTIINWQMISLFNPLYVRVWPFCCPPSLTIYPPLPSPDACFALLKLNFATLYWSSWHLVSEASVSLTQRQLLLTTVVGWGLWQLCVEPHNEFLTSPCYHLGCQGIYYSLNCRLRVTFPAMPVKVDLSVLRVVDGNI